MKLFDPSTEKNTLEQTSMILRKRSYSKNSTHPQILKDNEYPRQLVKNVHLLNTKNSGEKLLKSVNQLLEEVFPNGSRLC